MTYTLETDASGDLSFTITASSGKHEIKVEDASDLSSCQNLSIENATYYLLNNVSSAGTCMNVTANNVTLDCQGFMINYSLSVLGYAVNSTGYNYTNIKNCNIYLGNSSTGEAHAIYLNQSSFGNVSNNTINVTSESNYGGHGVLVTSSVNNTIFNNTIRTKPGNYFGRGVYLSYSSNNSILSNTITTGETYQYYSDGIDIYVSSQNTISNNNISTRGSACTGIYIDTSSNLNTITGNNITSLNSSNAIIIDDSSYSNLSNNILYSNDINSIVVFGSSINHFNHSIDTTNLAEGLPVLYYFNNNSGVIENQDYSSLYGQVMFAWSTNVTINNVTMANDGLSFFNVSESLINDSKVETNKGLGIYIWIRF